MWKPKWRVAHKNGPEEDSEGKMGPKQSGDDRGGSVAQERRRCRDGWRAAYRRSRDDEPDYKEKLEMEEHVPVPKRVYDTREGLEVFGFTARCPRVHGIAQGDGETSAQKTAEGGLKRSWMAL